jgi:hypothetical protein
MNHHAPQWTHPEAVLLAHIRLCSYTPEDSTNQLESETRRVRHQVTIHLRWRWIYLCTTTLSVIGEECFGMEDWSGTHDAISVDY